MYNIINLHNLYYRPDRDGWTPLHVAVAQGKLPIVQYLLEIEGIKVDARIVKDNGREGVYAPAQSTALHIAAEKGFTKIAEVLLGAGAQRSARNRLQETPLIIAAGRGHPAIVQLLLKKYSVTIEDKNWSGNTALHVAILQEEVEVSRILIEARADMSTCDKDGDTPLHNAARIGSLNMVKLLLKKNIIPQHGTLRSIGTTCS